MAKTPVEGGEEERVVRRPIVKFTHKIEASHDDDQDDDPPAPPKKGAKTEFEEVDIGGKKYKVEKGGAEALRASLKPKKPAVSESQQIRQMLEEYTAKMAPKPKKATEPDDDDDEKFSDTRLFTDTKGFMKDFKASLSKEILAAVGGAYNQDQGQKAFWSGFYGMNSDLKDYDFIVKAVLEKNKQELAPMDVNEASERLAELAREQLLTIAKKVNKGGKGDKKKFHVEGESTSRRDADNDDGEDEDDDEADRKAGMPMTMSALMKLRQQRRRQGKSPNQATEEGEE